MNKVRQVESNQKKVLVIAPTPYFSDRGCHIRIYEETNALIKLGHRVKICTYHIGRDVIPRNAKLVRVRTRFRTYNKQDAGWHWMKPLLDLQLLFVVVKEMRRFLPDVVHAHLQEGIAIGLIAKKITRSKAILVFDSQGEVTEELAATNVLSKKTMLAWMTKKVEMWLMRSADLVVTSSEPLRKVYMQYRKTGIMVVNDAPMHMALKEGDTVAARRQLSIPATARVVLYAGSLLPYKGIEDFLQACVHVLKQVPEAFFLIVGYPNTETYQKMAGRMGIPLSAILFTGRVPYENLALYVCAADVGVEPKKNTSHESSAKVLNYLVAGLRVAAYRSVHLESILGASHPWFATENTPNSLAEAIVSALCAQKKSTHPTLPSWSDEMDRYLSQAVLASKKR